MSTTVNYKGSTITTVNNQTKTLSTAGKWLEGNIQLVDVTEEGAAVLTDETNTTGTTAVITGVVPEYGTKTITANGTYSAEDDDLDGYSEVTVNVPSSGGGSTDGDVKFIDYDGTVVESYSASEFASLSAMPNNPTHTGLIAQGWNWSLADAKTYVANHGELVIGQMYKTASGKAEIDVTFDDPKFLSPYLSVCPNGTITIDWGDGSATETMTGTSYTTLKYLQHVYPRTGSYTISIDGNVGFYSNNTSSSVLSIWNYLSQSRLYAKCITAIRLSETSAIGIYAFTYLISMASITIPNSVTSFPNNAFRYCYSLTSITIPDGVTSIANSMLYTCYSLTSVAMPNGVINIGSQAFQNCYALNHITIPDSVTSIGSNAFSTCYSLTSISIPNGVTSIENNIFYSCYSLTSISIPDSVTSIGSNAFQYCYTLSSIIIPEGVTSIGSNAFQHCYVLNLTTIPEGVTSIENNTFYNCESLSSITIPDGVTSIGNHVFYSCDSLSSITIPDSVTSIGNNVFQNCISMFDYHFLSTTPPTLGTNAFSGIATYTVIYVPQGSLEAYQTATNWSTYASYMQEEVSA